MKKFRRAFTLIELLAVIGIIALLTAVLIGLKPTSPAGLNGATAEAQSVFALARAQAMLANNPDELHPTFKLYTPRARVIICNDPTDTNNYLRRMGVILGGQLLDPSNPSDMQKLKTEALVTEPDLTWYAIGEGTMLPDGIFYVPEGSSAVSKAILQSAMQDNTFPSTPTMTIGFPSRQSSKTSSLPKQSWYYYEFLGSGAANMSDAANQTGARFMITEGLINPATQQLESLPDKQNIVGGFLILHPGNTVSINNKYETQ